MVNNYYKTIYELKYRFPMKSKIISSIAIINYFNKKLDFMFYLLALFFVTIWQKTRSFREIFLFSHCRFYPSCSDYFLESIKKHGLISGSVFSFKRICKCHPFNEGGIDEVPL